MVLRGPGALLICFHTWIAVLAISACQFGTNCIYPCHCLNNAPCDPITGECPGGACDDGNPHDNWSSGAWYGPACQIGNAAYNKSAEQGEMDYEGNVASRAVDGNWTRELWEGHCSHTKPRTPHGNPHTTPSWWQVDLGQQHVIFNVTIFNRDYFENRLSNTYIEVSNTTLPDSYQACEQIVNGNKTKFHKQCYPPMIGRYLRLRRTGFINICEVNISAYIFKECDTNRFGAGCVTSCNCDDRCDLISGHCPGTCTPGWEGEDCQQQCDTNRFGAGCVTSCNCDDRCDLISGHCPGTCTPGWEGEDCQQPCTDGAWGHMCSERCNCLNSTEVCDHVSGRCSLSGCATHYVGIGCNAVSSPVTLTAVIVAILLIAIIVAVSLLLRYRHRVPSVRNLLLKRTPPSDGIGDAEGSNTPTVNSTDDGNHYEDVLSYENVGYTNDLQLPSNPISVYNIPEYIEEKKKLPDAFKDEFEKLPKKQTANWEVARTKSLNFTDDGSHYEDVLSYENVGYTNDLQLPSNPISVYNIPEYIEEKKKLPDAFKDEFEKLPKKQTASWEVARTKANLAKNRFHNIFAYDHSRVVLPLDESGTCSDYINANYIPGYKDDKAYIATQGPKASTVVDLWRMIWLEDINRLVTVGKPMEAGKVKYEAYWPTGELLETTTVGDFTVKLRTNKEYADFTVRKLSLSHEGQSRPLTQFHFTAWPDHGVPEMATSLLELRRKVRAQDDIASGPMLIHCSAGIGPTGTFIAIDYLLDQAEVEGRVDVLQCVALMRNNRINMVQNLDQYVFIHNALLQALIAGDTAIASRMMEEEYTKLQEVDPSTGENILQKQFQALVGLKPICDRENLIGLLEENQKKNYSELIIPANIYRLCLLTRVPNTNDYINAVYVAGYRSCRAYIVTQRPLAGTIQDYWRLVYDHGCHSSVLLDTIDSVNQECPAFWPTNVDDSLAVGPLTIKMTKEEPAAEDILMREFTITRRKKTEPVTLRQFVLHGWQETQDVPPNVGSLLTLMELLERWQQKTGNQPIIVQCRTGAHHSGVFCAASYMIEKLKLDKEVDVFHSVARVRTFRPQFIVSLEQYAFLHDLAVDFFQSHATYSNFK